MKIMIGDIDLDFAFDHKKYQEILGKHEENVWGHWSGLYFSFQEILGKYEENVWGYWSGLYFKFQ